MSSSSPFPAGPDHAEVETPFEINVILAYESLSAALWAAETLTGLLRRISGGAEPRLSPWSFSTLENPALRPHATAAAVAADLIVITTSSGFSVLPASVESWLGKSLAERRHATTAVAALFGQPNRPDRADSPRLQTVQRLARDAGCEFFAPQVTEAILTVA